ncbi:hypothetical protein [Vibrio sp. Hal054]|uniref:hypothetical protein n=1 Tax=Vibrio sp. Hal054 TaxID=3035158 RepID=UPI00301C8E47
MTSNKKKFLLTAIACCLMSVSAISHALTIAEYEARIKEINDAAWDTAEKTKAIKDLENLWDAQAALARKIALASAAENPARESSAATTDTSSVQQKSSPVGYQDPIGWNFDKIYMVDSYQIGNGVEIKAQLYVNGDPVTVDINKAIKNKEQFGNYILVKYQDDRLLVKHLKTNKTEWVQATSAEQIAAKVENNNLLMQKYQEKYALGVLDAQLEVYTDSQQTPVSVSYKTLEK